ncbi:MAG: hypothetical protein ACOCUR_01755 [Nanoarchaeota archaeon]
MFVFNATIKEERMIEKGIELSKGACFVLADNRTMVKYLGVSGKKHLFEIGELRQFTGGCHFRYTSYPDNSLMLLNSSCAYKVKSNGEAVRLLPAEVTEKSHSAEA